MFYQHAMAPSAQRYNNQTAYYNPEQRWCSKYMRSIVGIHVQSTFKHDHKENSKGTFPQPFLFKNHTPQPPHHVKFKKITISMLITQSSLHTILFSSYQYIYTHLHINQNEGPLFHTSTSSNTQPAPTLV